MSKILSAMISTLSFPTVECKAGNCLFNVGDIYNVSIYNRHISYSSSCQKILLQKNQLHLNLPLKL